MAVVSMGNLIVDVFAWWYGLWHPSTPCYSRYQVRAECPESGECCEMACPLPRTP